MCYKSGLFVFLTSMMSERAEFLGWALLRHPGPAFRNWPECLGTSSNWCEKRSFPTDTRQLAMKVRCANKKWMAKRSKK